MRIAFLILVGYAALGVLYLPGLESLTALCFIAASGAPLLLAGRAGEAASLRLEPPKPVLYWGVLALGTLNVLVIARRLERSMADLASLEGVVEIAATSTSERYAGSLEAGSGNPLLLALSLWLIFRVGTSVDRLSKTKQGLAFVPVVCYTLLTTEKWPLFLALVFFFAGMLPSFPPRRAMHMGAVYLAALAPFVLLIGSIAMVLRGWVAVDALEMLGGLLHYVLAPYPAFGDWLIRSAGDLCCAFGSHTFVGPLDAMGAVTRRAGVWGETVMVYDLETNIYTAFRYLVEDFSIIGPFLIACWFALGYHALMALNQRALARLLEVFVLFAVLMSLNVTPFVHNSTAFGIALALASTLRPSLRVPVPLRQDASLLQAGTES